MRADFGMPSRQEIEEALLKILLKHNGVIKEFNSGEEIVDELSDYFNLSEEKRTVHLERIYRKENRVVKSLLWHRLLFRAADALAKDKLISRPSVTFAITKKKEWMLTESGFDKALSLSNIPLSQKDYFATKSFEVQKIVKKLTESPRPERYNPFDIGKKNVTSTRETTLRRRGFRQAVIEAYNCKCAFCGIKISSPDSMSWEVEAAHIVPHCFKGKDDIWNGLALCRLHHWAFDVGWFTLENDFTIQVSQKANVLPSDYGRMVGHDIFSIHSNMTDKILLPLNNGAFPHPDALAWHRENIFYK